MKRYEKYKKTDLPWLEEVPEHWEMLKIGQLFENRKEKNKPVKTENVLSLSAKYGVVPYEDRIEKGGNKPKEDMTQYNICHKGDILVNCMNIVAGAVGLSNYYGAISPVYYALNIRDEKNKIDYFEYIFRDYYFQRGLIGLGKGIQMSETEDGRLYTCRMRISYDALKRQYISVPPKSEQEKIAAFLDHKIRRGDKAIELEEKKKEEIKNLKLSLISDIIDGKKKILLNDGGFELEKRNEFKNVDITWIDRIPKDWTVLKGKRVLKLLERKVETDDDVITCFRDGEVTLRKNRRTDGFTNSLKEIGYQGIEPGDLVIHGMDGFAGAIGISDSRGKASPVLVVCDSIENKRYLMYYLRNLAYHDVFLALSTGIRVRSCDLRWNKIANMDFIIPSKEEQILISDYLDYKTKDIDRSIDKISKKIKCLEDFKQSLISEVVTGQIDVRDFEIPKEVE